MKSHYFKQALLPKGWAQNVRVSCDQGVIQSVEVDVPLNANDAVQDVVIPAMPNAHSHVFQRAMAGLSEYKTHPTDSFWSWRDLMYRLANDISAEQIYEVAKTCYLEMKKAGYASVCEFHYVHRDLKQRNDVLSMSKAVMQAAHDVGLPMTMLPVLYAFSGVGDQPLNGAQQRFGLSTEEYIDLWLALEKEKQPNQSVGICFHSLRAVNQNMMEEVINALPKDVPIHIHIAEQQAEIDQMVGFHGKRPAEWLFDHFDVDQRWSLVHATHLTTAETQMIADSGAVAVLCPLTEANLGDGVFPMPLFQSSKGVWAIGSDSHIEIKPAQELKMLEYSQRLMHQKRNVCCDEVKSHVGTWMWLNAVQGGRQSSGMAVAGIEVGTIARFIALSGGHPQVDLNEGAAWLDTWIFSDHVAARAFE